MKNRMFGDDQPDQPSPRTTIVGGRPPESASKLPPVPTGLQSLLRLAAIDASFRDELLARRSAIAAAAGVELVVSERAILDAAPVEQLTAMAASLPQPPTDRRTFLKEAALAALAVLTGQALQGCRASADADEPPRPDHNEMSTKGGHAPNVPPPAPGLDAGVPRPESSHPTRGIRPDQLKDGD